MLEGQTNPSASLPSGVRMEATGPYRGSLGRTLRVPMTVASGSGATFVASVFTQVSVSEEPGLRASAYEGTLNVVVDPHTGARYNLAVPVLYHDERLCLFVLLAPDSLRHREYALRREVLERLSAHEEGLPAYVRRFRVVFGPVELEHAEQEARDAHAAPGAAAAELTRLRKELEDREHRLLEDRHSLEAMRLNLEELQARLKDQEESLVRAGLLVAPSDEEPTSVVPREVFYGPPKGKKGRSVVPGPAQTGETPVASTEARPGWGTGLESGWELEERSSAPPLPRPSSPSRPAVPPVPKAALGRVSAPPIPASAPASASPVAVPPIPPSAGAAPPAAPAPMASSPPVPGSGSRIPAVRSSPSQVSVTDDLPRTFNRLKAGSRSYYHTEAGGEALLAYRLPEGRMGHFLDVGLRLYLQFHDLEEFPLVSLLLVCHGADDVAQDDIYWPLDVRKPTDRRLLDKLMGSFRLRVALYGEDLQLRQVLTFDEPLELNATHVTQLAERRLATAKGELVDFEGALRRLEAPDYERLGSMRHNFHRESFTSVQSPSEAKLAAGIVGYWSGPETFRYLIENRSFSLEWFAQIQERVVRAAVKFGIVMTSELRQVAVDIELAADEAALVQHLASTWAQTTLGVGVKNDLDELGEWENWQGLIEAMDDLGLRLDEALSGLAQSSLQRARRFVKEHNLPANLPDGDLEVDEGPEEAAEAGPGQATQIDMTGGLKSAPRKELIALLGDEERRLAAARQLVERADPTDLKVVLDVAEEMEDEELSALSETLSAMAMEIEGPLIEALSEDSPTIAYLAVFALCTMRSKKARPLVLEVIQDEERAPDPFILAEALALYGEELLDDLIAALHKAGEVTVEHPLVILLANLARSEGDDVYEYVETEFPKVVAMARTVKF